MAHTPSDTNQGHAGAHEIVRLKKEFLVPCSYHFYTDPPQIVKGKGTKLYDSEDRVYTDFFAGVSVMSFGHSNEEITERVIQQIRTLQHTTSIYLTEPVVRLAERMASILPGEITRSFFCNSGSEANEGAMLLARIATGRRSFIALEGALHGRTFLTSGANGIPMWRTDPFIGEVPVHFASTTEDVVSIIEEKGDEIAALLVEPLQGNGGIRPLPPDFFAILTPLLKEKGILLICDEVQSGFARTGKMFAIEHYTEARPDIITGAKALGNGFPIGFYAAKEEIAATFTRPSASTLGGNPVSCTAALAVLDYIENHAMVEQAMEKGEAMKRVLTQIADTYTFMGAPRGFGLMLGLPVFPLQSAEKELGSAEAVDLILEKMKDKGFLIGKNGLNRDVLAFQPPLIISEEEITEMAEALDETLDEIVGEL